MFKYPILILAAMLILFVNPQKVKAADTGDVVINEVMTSPAVSSTGEFIELYNNSDTAIDLSR